VGLLNSFFNEPLFSQAWVDALKATPEAGMVSTIKVYDPNTGAAVYDPVTGTYVTVPTILYTGKARVQPIRGARATAVAGNDTFTQMVLVSIPIDAGKLLDLRPRHRMQVTAAPLNPTLTMYLFAVQEVLDSTNPIERTFYCTTNLETVVA